MLASNLDVYTNIEFLGATKNVNDDSSQSCNKSN